MKTNWQEILKKELVGKTLISDGTHIYNLKIVDIDNYLCYDGQIVLHLERDVKVDVYINQEIEVLP